MGFSSSTMRILIIADTGFLFFSLQMLYQLCRKKAIEFFRSDAANKQAHPEGGQGLCGASADPDYRVPPDGVEVLIHIGMDTIRLDGKYFSAHVKQGDQVRKGQLRITFGQAAIEQAGYITETPIVITNTDDYLDIVTVAEGSVQSWADLLAVLTQRSRI